MAFRNSPPFSASRVGAGRDRDDLVDLVRFGQPPELRQHLERGVHRLRRERPAVEAAGAQADHFLFAVDDLERQVGPHLHHDHVDRVGADVDGGQTHGCPYLTRGWGAKSRGRYNRELHRPRRTAPFGTGRDAGFELVG